VGGGDEMVERLVVSKALRSQWRDTLHT
jgi:hypothetical protein